MAAEHLIGAYERWPRLFQDFRVRAIRSGERMHKPIPKSNLTAEEIIQNMFNDDDEDNDVAERDECLAHAQDLQKFRVDDLIQKELANQNFRPIVHSEVLVHDYLVSRGLTHPSYFWNEWKYIGSSKPTCRLCNYYFFVHQFRFEVRPSHMNLYIAWRLPDLPKNDEAAKKSRAKLLKRLIDQVRNDAKTTLREKTFKGRVHDSFTNSAQPEVYRLINQGAGSANGDIEHGTLSLTLNDEEEDKGEAIEDQEELEYSGDSDFNHTDDEFGGVSVSRLE